MGARFVLAGLLEIVLGCVLVTSTHQVPIPTEDAHIIHGKMISESGLNVPFI